MRSIYATLAVLLLIVTTATAGFAQSKSKPKPKPKEIVTRTIIGCTLGESTIEQIKKAIQEQNGTIGKIKDGEEGPRVQVIHASGVKFFGKIQDAVVLKTVDGVLYAVGFIITEKDEADRLKRSLPDKYEGWEETHTNRLSQPYEGGYSDSSSSVVLSYNNDGEFSEKFKFAILLYLDKKLSKKSGEIENSDL